MSYVCPIIPDILDIVRKRQNYSQKDTNGTNNDGIDLIPSQIRRNLKVMIPNPNIPIDTILPNGDSVGKFSVKYMIYLDQKNSKKRMQKKMLKKTQDTDLKFWDLAKIFENKIY